MSKALPSARSTSAGSTWDHGRECLGDSGQESKELPHVGLVPAGLPDLHHALRTLDARQCQVFAISSYGLGDLNRRGDVSDTAPATRQSALNENVHPSTGPGTRHPLGKQLHASHRIDQAVEIEARIAEQLTTHILDICCTDQLVGVEDSLEPCRRAT